MTGSDAAPRGLVLLGGLAFSGKTTLALAISRQLSLVYVSLDETNAWIAAHLVGRLLSHRSSQVQRS
jgi:shikimate kinase